MKWTDNPNQHTLDDIERWSYPPSGGRGKLIVLGIILPIIVLYHAAGCWIDEAAMWPVRRGANMEVYGNTAKSLAAAIASMGLFFHFRWFWGLLPQYLIYTVGVMLSLLSFAIAVCCGIFYMAQ